MSGIAVVTGGTGFIWSAVIAERAALLLSLAAVLYWAGWFLFTMTHLLISRLPPRPSPDLRYLRSAAILAGTALGGGIGVTVVRLFG